MTASKTRSFSSSDLQQAVDQSKGILERFDEARNQVSRDIKELEAYLATLGLTTAFRYGLGKCFVDPGGEDAQHLAASLEYSGSASGVIEEEALAWTQDAAGRFRLMYETTRWEGSIEVDLPGGPLFWDESTAERHAKPLIETKFEIRKRMYSRLGDFGRALSEHLSIEPSATTKPSLEDLPF